MSKGCGLSRCGTHLAALNDVQFFPGRQSDVLAGVRFALLVILGFTAGCATAEHTWAPDWTQESEREEAAAQTLRARRVRYAAYRSQLTCPQLCREDRALCVSATGNDSASFVNCELASESCMRQCVMAAQVENAGHPTMRGPVIGPFEIKDGE